MDNDLKNILHSIIVAILFIFLFLILTPFLIQLLDHRWGKVLYGVLVAGALFVAFRLRFLSRHLH